MFKETASTGGRLPNNASAVLGLVVDETRGGEGVGRLLMVAEERAAERGCDQVRVRSDVTRKGAQRVYAGIGYEIRVIRFVSGKRL